MIENRLSIILTVGCIIGILGLMLKAWDQPIEIYIPAIATLIAAFAGVWFANLLQSEKEKKKLVDMNLIAVNKAIDITYQIYDNYRGYQEDIIEPARKSEIKWLIMKSTPKNHFDKIIFPINELSFLYNSKHIDFLRELQLCEKIYKKFTELNGQRNEIRVKAIDIIESAGIPDMCTLDDMAKLVTPRTAVELESITNPIIEIVDNQVERTADLYFRFREAMRPLFHGRLILKIEALGENTEP